MDFKIGNGWDEVLSEKLKNFNQEKLLNFLRNEYAKKDEEGNEIVYPPWKDVFNAFRLTSYEKTKVVILGQDPYPNPRQAHGLAFSVPQGEKLPYSLRIIYKEIEREFEKKCDWQNGCLDRWAEQGVLLLNTVLTVRKGEPKSHFIKGWEEFTGSVIQKLYESKFVIFMLWGRKSQSDFAHKVPHSESNPFVLKAPHPASIPNPKKGIKGFIGCGCFQEANHIIEENKLGEQINW